MPSFMGIDFGNGCVKAAVYLNGNIRYILNNEGEVITPNYVAFTETGRLIGEPALNQAHLNSENTICNYKYLLGQRYDNPAIQDFLQKSPFEIKNDDGYLKILVTDRGEVIAFAPEEIAAMVLLRLKMTAEVYLGTQIVGVVIPVPPSFDAGQRKAVKNAGRIAGFEIINILSEPAAAAIAYGLRNDMPDEERNVLTIDFGCVNFDLAILTIKNGNKYEVKGTECIDYLSGTEFDKVLVEHCCDVLKNEYNKDISEHPGIKLKLQKACEEAKIGLSTADECSVKLDSSTGDINLNTKITKSKFEELSAHLFEKAKSSLDAIFESVEMEKSSIHNIILVGGSTNIPKFRTLVREFFDYKELFASINSDRAVVHGAAVEAALASGEPDDTIKEITLLDTVPLSIGIETSGGVMSKLIERNTPLSCKVSRIFTTAFDNQSKVSIRIYRGERLLTVDNKFLGEVEVSNLPELPKGVLKIEVTFEIDRDGILTVQAVDMETGKARNQSVRNSMDRLTNEEIEKMIRDADKFREEDEREKERVIQINLLKSKLYNLNAKAESLVDLSRSEKDTVKAAYFQFVQWLRENASVQKSDVQDKWNKAMETLSPYMDKLNSK